MTQINADKNLDKRIREDYLTTGVLGCLLVDGKVVMASKTSGSRLKACRDDGARDGSGERDSLQY